MRTFLYFASIGFFNALGKRFNEIKGQNLTAEKFNLEEIADSLVLAKKNQEDIEIYHKMPQNEEADTGKKPIICSHNKIGNSQIYVDKDRKVQFWFQGVLGEEIEKVLNSDFMTCLGKNYELAGNHNEVCKNFQKSY